MKKKVIKGDVFIVPNYASELNDFPEHNQDWFKEKLSRLTGIEAEKEERMIQLWITSNTCDNWQDRFAGFQKIIGILNTESEEIKWENRRGREARLLGYFPRYFPSKIFEGKNEGDIVTLDCPEYEVVIELSCKQLDYRYKNFGRFEEAFKYVLGD